MTVYFHNVLWAFTQAKDLKFSSSMENASLGSGIDLHIEHDSGDRPPDMNCSYRASHIIRHPKDLLVSAYYYHLRSDEAWCHQVPSLFDHVKGECSYQQHLSMLSLEEGLLFELEGATGRVLRHFDEWNYSNANVMELKFENVMGNERNTFTELFKWYGYEQKDCELAGELADQRSAARLTDSTALTPHRRKGSKIGQWREVLTPKVNEVLDTNYAHVFEKTGYDKK